MGDWHARRIPGTVLRVTTPRQELPVPRTRASMTAALRLNPRGWTRLRQANSWASNEAAARGLGLAATTITRALKDETQPSGVLLAHVLAASRAAGIPDHEILDVVILGRSLETVAAPR